MGARRSVSCRCFVDGLSMPPPCVPRELPPEVQYHGFIQLDLPYVGHDEECRPFDEWQANCCTHPCQDLTTFKFSRA